MRCANSPSNLARALILLEKQGLIKLKDSTDLFATSLDIIENPKNLQIKEVDTSVAARALDDLDLAVVNNTYAGQVGLTASRKCVFVMPKTKDSLYNCTKCANIRQDNTKTAKRYKTS